MYRTCVVLMFGRCRLPSNCDGVYGRMVCRNLRAGTNLRPNDGVSAPSPNVTLQVHLPRNGKPPSASPPDLPLHHPPLPLPPPPLPTEPRPGPRPLLPGCCRCRRLRTRALCPRLWACRDRLLAQGARAGPGRRRRRRCRHWTAPRSSSTSSGGWSWRRSCRRPRRAVPTPLGVPAAPQVGQRPACPVVRPRGRRRPATAGDQVRRGAMRGGLAV